MRASRSLLASCLLAAGGFLLLQSPPGMTAPRPAGAKPRPGARPTPAVPAPPAGKPGAPAARPEPAVPPPGNEIMPVADVRPGMRGYGLTVFRGATIERFDVEVVSVLPKQNFGQSYVLVRLRGGPISERGAFMIRGMSGSPVYVNGKLLGAYSAGYQWTKEPLGMVTPIEDMLEALDPKLSSVPAGGYAAAPLSPPAFAAAGPAAGLFPSPADAVAAAPPRAVQRLGLPVTVSGLSGWRLDRAAEALRPFNMALMEGPGGMGQPFKAGLEPGAALGVAFMTGDIDMTGIGTVTYRDGDRLLAFGHPMMDPAGIGATQFPITTAWIHDVQPLLQSSFKLGSAGTICGTLTQDRPFSIAGKVGPAPVMIPIRCDVTDESTGRKRVFNVQAANHPLLVGQLLPLAVNQAMFNVRPVPGDTLARVKMVVETDGAGTIERENVVFDPAQIDVAAVRELQELMGILTANQFNRVPVKGLNFQVSFQSRHPTATVDRIFLSTDRVKPGDDVDVGVVLRPYRKEPVVLRQKIRVPESAASGRALLLVQGGATRVNTSLLAGGAPPIPGGIPGAPPPDASLRQVIRRFTDRELNNQVVVKILFPTTAVNVEGERLSRLPSTIVEVMRSSRTTGFRIERDEARELRDTDYVVQGVQALSLTIEKESQLEKPAAGAAGSGAAGGPGLGSPLVPRPLFVDPVEGDELSADDPSVLRLTVDGRPKLIRLSPEEEEKPKLKPEGRAAGRNEERPAGRGGRPDGKAGSAPAGSAASPAAGKSEETPDAKLVGRQAKLWTQTTKAHFEGGTFANAAVTSSGEVRLAPALRLAHESDEQFVWSVAGAKGAVYAGTGNGGRVLKVDADGRASVFFSTGELEVHALAHDATGNLYAGTSPNGRLFRISPDGKGTELLAMNGGAAASDAGGKFVLSLAVAADGTLYAGTGPEGRVYRIPPGGKPQELCRLGDQSVMTLLLAPDGALYAGTAEEGAVYRISLDGPAARARVLYDTDQAVVTGLAMDAAGVLYAACAPSGDIHRIEPDGAARVHFKGERAPLYDLKADGSGSLYTCSANRVMRVEPDGTATILTDQKNGQFTCLAWEAESGRLVAGSSNTGSVYRLAAVISGSFESTVHDAKLPARWGRMRYTGVLPPGGVLTVETRSGSTPEPDASWSPWEKPLERDGSTFVASPAARFIQYRVLFQAEQGSPALRDMAIAYLPRNQPPKLTLAAPAGGEIWRGTQTLKWSAADPDADTLTYELAYSADGGRTWKPVGETSADAPAPAPPARTGRASAEDALKRYRAQLEEDKTLTPRERDDKYEKAKALVEQFLKENPGGDPAPAATPPAPAAKGPAPAAKGPAGVTREASFAWDTRQVADGIYLLRVTASDRASNPGEPLSDTRVTEPFIIANTAPQLFLFEKGITVDGAKNALLVGFAAGRVSIRGGQYRVGGGDWTAIEAEDGIWDSAFEHFRVSAGGLASGEHTLEVKVVDAAGNVATGKAAFRVP